MHLRAAPVRHLANRSPALILLAAVLVLVVVGCGAGWHQPEELTPGALPAGQQVRVWMDGEVARWHGLVLSPDSISGVNWLQKLDCDSCRITVARARVDSVQLGHPVAGFWKTTGLVVGVMLAASCYAVGCF